MIVSKKKMISALLVGISVFSVAGAASAHTHQILTPGAGDPLISPEPYHGTDPTNGAILNNPIVPDNATTLHPIHFFLHKGPGQDHSAIDVIVYSAPH